MTHIKDFNEIFDFFKKRKLVQSLKEFSLMTGNSYTYLSELKNGKKPLTPDFVQSLSELPTHAIGDGLGFIGHRLA